MGILKPDPEHPMEPQFQIPHPCVPIAGLARGFPVRRIWCVARNYAAHAREMGFPEREPPFFFAKPADAVVPEGGPVPYPPKTANLHHEIELVVAIGKGGRNLQMEQAAEHVFGLAVGLDLTRRDLQAVLKEKGQPWELSKSFDHSAPIGVIHPLQDGILPERAGIWLKVNGEDRQRSDIAKMIWSVPAVLMHLSAFVALAPGDLVFTGTPEGVGPLQRGDQLLGGIDGLGELAISIV
jgi:fumarylpyruvate hydrolase